MSESKPGRWLVFELPAAQADHVQRAARRMGLEVETLAEPRFRVKVRDAEQAYELGKHGIKATRSSSSRRRR